MLEVDGIVTRFGTQTIHDGVSFRVHRGQLVALIGGSGTGKSVLLREIIGLMRPTAGSVRLLGTDIWKASAAELAAVRRRFGMMFQDGALFSSLDVAHNVAVPLVEHTDLRPGSALAAGPAQDRARGSGARCRSEDAERALRRACASARPSPAHWRWSRK